MTQYITEIQRQLIKRYGFKAGENGCPKDVPDGAYPMMIDKKLDLVLIVGGNINCCNLIGSRSGLQKFQALCLAKVKSDQVYPCGCSATSSGPEPVPTYCPTHQA